jgi:hypothetical protein
MDEEQLTLERSRSQRGDRFSTDTQGVIDASLPGYPFRDTGQGKINRGRCFMSDNTYYVYLPSSLLILASYSLIFGSKLETRAQNAPCQESPMFLW